MDWKRWIYIWQNSRRTDFKLQAVLKITLGAIWECSRAGKGKNAASKITWVASGTAVWMKEGLSSRESFAPPVCVLARLSLRLEGQHMPPDNGRGKRNSSVPATAPLWEQTQERRTKGFSHPLMENLPPPPARGWKSRWRNWSMILTVGHNRNSRGKQLRKSKGSC